MMSTRVLGLLFLAGLTIGVCGEEAPRERWEKSMLGGINMTQTGFDNWVSGGESTFSWQLNASYSFVQKREKTTWSNTGKLVYGATKTGEAALRKSIDELKLESVLTYKMGSTVNPYIALTGESQFAASYNYALDPVEQISAFLNPGYFRESFGAGMTINENFRTRLGLSFKQTVSSDYPVPYTDDVETAEIETLRSEFGSESVSDMSWKISETSLFNSKLELFSSLKALDETDVNWDNTLTVKVSEYINMNVNIKLIYDKDISVKRQLKQAMALGLNYTVI